jgi:hypothetical protein
MDPKGKGMVVNDKEKESFLNEPMWNPNTLVVLLGPTRLVTIVFGTQIQVLSPLHLDPNFLATTFSFLYKSANEVLQAW